MMWRNAIGAFVIVVLSVGLVVAEPVKGKITKIGDGKITVVSGKKGETKTTEYDLAKDVKVLKLEGKDKLELQGGLKNEALQSIDAKKGINAVVNVEGNKVTEIVISQKKKKDAN